MSSREKLGLSGVEFYPLGNMAKHMIVVYEVRYVDVVGFAALSLPHREKPSGVFQPRGTLADDCTSWCDKAVEVASHDDFNVLCW